MTELLACPPVDEYRRLARGESPPEAAEPLLAHLESCGRCSRLVEGLSESDTMVDLVRQAATIVEPATSATVAGLIERLSRLRPDSSQEPVDDSTDASRTQPPVRTSGPAKTAEYDFLSPPQAADEIGRLGRYRVLRVLGAGGMGVVFRAHDTQLDRIVALKAMLPRVASSEGARERFVREARAAAAIKHDHIVSIYDINEDRGVSFLAMEFLEGEPLESRLDRVGRLPLAEVLRIGREVALGLAAAHGRGLVHRDIKPANIWLEARTGRVKILDFGLARGASKECQLTQEGAIVGTPAFMSPEQAQGREVDHRTDLFSLGCVLYQMATGRAPFHGTDVVSLLVAVAVQNPVPPSRMDPPVPRPLSDLILKLLSKDAAARPASAQAVAEALERMAREPAPSSSSVATSLGRRKSLFAGAVAAGILLVGFLSWWASGALFVKSKEGTIVLEDVPSDAEIHVDGEAAKVSLGVDGRSIEIRVVPGERKLLIKADGFKAKTQDVALASGDRKPIRIRLEPEVVAAPDASAAAPPGDDGATTTKPGAPPFVSRRANVLRGNWEKTEDGLIQHDTSRSFPALAFGDASWRDYDFTVDAMRLEGNDQFALLFRLEGPGKLYWFGAAEWGNKWLQLGAKAQGKDHLFRRHELHLKNNQWYTARVKVRGNHVDCSISQDGQLLHAFEVEDNRHPAGRVGLRTCCSAVRFRNIRVTAPDGTVLWEGPPDLPNEPEESPKKNRRGHPAQK